jgi:hypothetical protein
MATDVDDPRSEQREGPATNVKSTLDNPELAQAVRTLFYQARDYRRPLITRWRKNYRTLNNRSAGGDSTTSSWQQTPRIAKVWPIVSSLVAWMTDQRPSLQVSASPEPFSPYGDFYQQLATDMNTTLRASFMEHQLDAEISRSLWDMSTYGIGWVKTVWEPHLADGLGDAVFRRKDPFTIYPDPFARNPQDMAFIIEAKTVTIDDLDRAFPGAKAALGVETKVEDVDEGPHQLDGTVNQNTPRVNLGALSPSTTSRYTTSSRNSTTRSQLLRDAPTVTILEAWIREHTIKPTDDPTVSQVIDRWKCVVVVGNLVLFDHYADECTAFSTHPYDRIVLFDTGEMYGPSLVEFLTSPQEAINRTLTAIEHNVMLMGNPVLVEGPRAQSRQQQLTNRPGQRIKANPEEVKWLNPPVMQPQIAMQLVSYYESQIEIISGLSAIVRGFSPTGRNSQGVLDSVQDAAFVRIRATLRELERTLRGAGSKMCASVAEFYTEPRIMSIIGDDGMHMHRALRARHFYANSGEAGERVPMRFTLLADAGSSLPTSQQARAGDAMTLFGLQAIDRLELLKAMNWPNYAIVAQRADANAALAPPTQRQATRS